MMNVHAAREAFGAWVKKLRLDAGLTLRALEAKTGGVTYSLISSIESGERAVGGSVAEKLATAFSLHSAEREQFLLKAAATRRRDRLVGYARTLAPEILNYVAWRLVKEGVDLTAIESCLLTPMLVDRDAKALVDAKQLEDQFKVGLADYLKALYGHTSSQDALVIRLSDGKQVICGILFAKINA
jgi:transcriptional regulator with XRE-family HTH domain